MKNFLLRVNLGELLIRLKDNMTHIFVYPAESIVQEALDIRKAAE